jgi:hypothetical protein
MVGMAKKAGAPRKYGIQKAQAVHAKNKPGRPAQLRSGPAKAVVSAN